MTPCIVICFRQNLHSLSQFFYQIFFAKKSFSRFQFNEIVIQRRTFTNKIIRQWNFSKKITHPITCVHGVIVLFECVSHYCLLRCWDRQYINVFVAKLKQTNKLIFFLGVKTSHTWGLPTRIENVPIAKAVNIRKKCKHSLNLFSSSSYVCQNTTVAIFKHDQDTKSFFYKQNHLKIKQI